VNGWKLLVALPIPGLLTPVACGFPTSGLGPGTGGAGGTSSSSAAPSSSSGSPTTTSTTTATSTSTSGGPTCSGTCEDVPPSWVAVYVKQVDPSDTSACTGNALRSMYFTEPAGTPTCNTCSCDLPQGALCSGPQLACNYQAGCNSPFPPFSAFTCVNALFGPGSGPSDVSCQVTGGAHKIGGWSCQASGGGMVAAPEWGGAYRACAATTTETGCKGSEGTCVSPGDKDEKLCIVQAGTVTCPSGWTGMTVNAFSGGMDGRSCSACSCSDSCQGGSYTAYDMNDCMGSSTPIDPGGACTDIGGAWSDKTGSLEPTPATPHVDQCNQPTPSGEVTGMGPTTICCP
jgi:hypothetical protein